MKKNLVAVILAAGMGSRLKDLTSMKPKAMIQYKGKEIILYQLEILKKMKFNKIIIVAGYKSNVLINFLKNKYKNLIFVKNMNYLKTNSAYSFICANEYISSNFYIHLNCDVLFSFDLLSKIISSPHQNIIASRKDLELSDKMENIIIDNKKKILDMSLFNSIDSTLKGFGLAKISFEAMRENIKKYHELDKNISENENYFGLIRRTLQYNPYHILESDMYNLSEINTLEDLNACKYQTVTNYN